MSAWVWKIPISLSFKVLSIQNPAFAIKAEWFKWHENMSPSDPSGWSIAVNREAIRQTAKMWAVFYRLNLSIYLQQLSLYIYVRWGTLRECTKFIILYLIEHRATRNEPSIPSILCWGWAWKYNDVKTLIVNYWDRGWVVLRNIYKPCQEQRKWHP